MVFSLFISGSVLTGILNCILAFLVSHVSPFVEGRKEDLIKWIITSVVFTIVQRDVNMSKLQQNLLPILRKVRMKDSMRKRNSASLSIYNSVKSHGRELY